MDNAIQPGILRYDWKSNVDMFVEFCRKECFNVFNKIKVFQQRKGKMVKRLSQYRMLNADDVG